jgi:5-methylcytosine-specific restriction protein A
MKGYCDDHSDQRSGWKRHQARHGNSDQRGYGHAWRKLRKTILHRDGHLCVSCKRSDRYVPATDVDHIITKASGGTDNPDNLQSLCRKCHRTKTANE